MKLVEPYVGLIQTGIAGPFLLNSEPDDSPGSRRWSISLNAALFNMN